MTPARPTQLFFVLLSEERELPTAPTLPQLITLVAGLPTTEPTYTGIIIFFPFVGPLNHTRHSVDQPCLWLDDCRYGAFFFLSFVGGNMLLGFCFGLSAIYPSSEINAGL